MEVILKRAQPKFLKLLKVRGQKINRNNHSYSNNVYILQNGYQQISKNIYFNHNLNNNYNHNHKVDLELDHNLNFNFNLNLNHNRTINQKEKEKEKPKKTHLDLNKFDIQKIVKGQFPFAHFQKRYYFCRRKNNESLITDTNRNSISNTNFFSNIKTFRNANIRNMERRNIKIGNTGNIGKTENTENTEKREKMNPIEEKKNINEEIETNKKEETKSSIFQKNNGNDIIDLELSEIWGCPNLKLYFKNSIFEISLNRPEKLNAINKDMLNNLINMLKSLETDDRCNLIILKSVNSKAFSAGSDVKDIVLHKQEGLRYLKQLYLYINHLSQMKTNVLCIWNGFVMGGGIGISIGSTFRLINKNVSFAMPENKIGFFPDIGSVYFLKKFVGRNITLHLGLTGLNINEQDLLNFRIATHYIKNINSFLQELYEIDNIDRISFDRHVKQLLEKHSTQNSETLPVLSKEMINNINKYYSTANNLTELINNLKKDEIENPFCKKLLSDINAHCFFTSNFWFAYCLYNFNRNLDFKQVLDNDFKVTQFFMFKINTFEKGVTERLIKKNLHFQWEKEETGGYGKFIENEQDIEEILTNENFFSIIDEFI